jgi:hypothetical protein
MWLYTGIIETNNSSILVLDTEGLGSTDVCKKSDSRIFLIALLLSSFFIFNSVGTIDENALNDVGLII